MCFSAGASFGASALLLGVGIGTIKKTQSSRMLAFASVPILFGVQQLSEGILWLSFTNPELVSWQNTSILIFLLFALVIWPVWTPFAVWLMKLFGWTIIGSLILSYIFYFHYVVSVWCFFAAVLSVLIFFVIVYNKESVSTTT